jgi:energy-coupling factor transporter ATP-binding protein EcfA2
MAKNQLPIILSGPQASGKSTIARLMTLAVKECRVIRMNGSERSIITGTENRYIKIVVVDHCPNTSAIVDLRAMLCIKFPKATLVFCTQQLVKSYPNFEVISCNYLRS